MKSKLIESGRRGMWHNQGRGHQWGVDATEKHTLHIATQNVEMIGQAASFWKQNWISTHLAEFGTEWWKELENTLQLLVGRSSATKKKK